MSFANFGIGVGAFTQGMRNGMQLGEQINQVRDRKEIRDVREQGLATAQQEREAEIDGNIEQTGLDGRSDFMGEMTTGYKVGDRTYGDQGEARERASQGVAGVMDRFMTDTAPKIRQRYLAQGDVEKAELWDQWVEDRQGKQAIADWSKSFMAARSGDWQSAAEGFGEYYTRHIDDGVDYRGAELIKDDAGQVTGFEIELFDRDTDESRSMRLATDELVDMGMAHNPQKLFDMAYQQQATANEARLENANDIAESQRDYLNKMGLESFKQEGRQALATHKSQLDAQEADAEVQDKIVRLERAGYDQDFINDMMPAILGIGEYQKQAPPEEVARLLHQKRLESSSPYAAGSYAKMSAEEQREIINADLAMFKEIGDTYSRQRRSSRGDGSTGTPSSVPGWYNPAQDGLR